MMAGEGNGTGFPLDGWILDRVEDMAMADGVVEDVRCELCGKERIRYAHVLRHPSYLDEIRVGSTCASKLLACTGIPGRRRVVADRAQAVLYMDFTDQEWRLDPATGDYVLPYKGEEIVARYDPDRRGWGAICRDVEKWDDGGERIGTLDQAKALAFDVFEEAHAARLAEEKRVADEQAERRRRYRERNRTLVRDLGLSW